MKPDFQKLWDNFPTHTDYPHLEDLYKWLGGKAEQNIDAPGFGPKGNTCASRLSVAFNAAGAPVGPGNLKGITTVGTKTKDRIIFRVSDFRTYLGRVLGEPTQDKTIPFNDGFAGKKGIIAFSVNWQNATGHIALWNGVTFREPTYDNYASYVDRDNPNIKTSLGEFWALA